MEIWICRAAIQSKNMRFFLEMHFIVVGAQSTVRIAWFRSTETDRERIMTCNARRELRDVMAFTIILLRAPTSVIMW